MTGRKHKKLSIIIPVYNEEAYILSTLKRVSLSDTLGLQKEIIVVDDGSTDRTKILIKKFEIRNSKFEFLEHACNQGKGAAIKTGIQKSTGDIVLIQDADLEYNPQDYPKLLKLFVEHNADVVYGSRFVSTESRRVLYYWHSVANFLLTNVSNMLTNLNFTDMETGYKVFSGELLRNIGEKLQSKRFGFEPEITARIAKVPELKIFEVGISYAGRTYTEGKKITAWDAVNALGAIIKYNVFSR
ncbi:MAG: glycosyltransferase family 2 protein [Patescibacteria group bacterium]